MEALAEKPEIDIEPEYFAELPDPSGYRILVMMPEIEEETEGGIIKPESAKYLEQTSSIFGFVLKLGPDAYMNKSRFPGEPWCKAGDWVLIRSYSGTRFGIKGKEFRLINDDTVEAVVEDPRGIERM